MARKNQRLINFHTSGLTSMPVASDVHYGEIVVRHNKQQPELLIKVSESEFGVIPGSGAVASAISVAAKNVTDYVDREVNTIESSITSLQKAVSAVSTNIGENYVSNEAFKTAQEQLFTSATTVASNDATIKANNAKNDAINAAAASAKTLQNNIDSANGRINTVSGNLNTFKTTVADTYATKTGVTSDIKNAKDSVYSSATTAAAADAQSKANTAKSDAIAAAAASADTLNKRIDTVDSKVGTLSGNVHTRIEGLKTDLTNTINNKVATAYRYKGSCTYAQLTGKTAEFTGEVWNVTDANGNYPAGTNYAWDGKKWDALGGSVDLSPYALKTQVTGASKTLQDNIDAANRRIDTVSGDLNTFKTTVASTYATKTDVTSDIADAKSAAISAAAADAKKKADAAYSSATTAAAASAKTLNSSIEAVDDRVDTVSGNLNTFKTDVANTYATKTDVASDITAAKNSVYSSATTAAAADAQSKANGAKTAAINAAAASAKTLNDRIDGVASKVSTLSASTVSIKATADKAVQTGTTNNGSGVVVTKNGTSLDFDFSGLIIDCGDF